MKIKIFFFLIFFIVYNVIQSQIREDLFISEIEKVYSFKKYNFKVESEKNLECFLKNDTNSDLTKYHFLFIPELLLKKSKKLYKNIDSTSVAKYFDPKSMFYHETLVLADTNYVGTIVEWYSDGNKICVPDYRTDERSSLLKKIDEYQVEIIFTVQYFPDFFYIKDGKIYSLVNIEEKNNKYSFISCSIHDYFIKYKSEIFMYYYKPRVKSIPISNES
jgi:hypothetical protein